MIHKLILILLITLTISANTDERVLSGVVKDAHTVKPLKGVKVEFKQGNVTLKTTTDKYGKYSLKITSVNGSVQFSKTSYRSITVKTGDQKIINIMLHNSH